MKIFIESVFVLGLAALVCTPVMAKDGDKAGRKKHLSGEVSSAQGKTKLNFDEASIEGSRRLPVGVAITKNSPDHAYDLINLRLRWHPEMILSTSNLETGQGR